MLFRVLFFLTFLFFSFTSWADSVEDFYLNRDGYTYMKTIINFSSYENGCWFCPLFRTLFTAMNTFAREIELNLIDVLTKFLILGFLFYLLFKVLQSFLSFGAINPKEFLTGLFVPFLKLMSVVLILYWGMPAVYRYIVNPLAELSIGFALEVNGTTTGLADLLNSTEVINNSGFHIPTVCDPSVVYPEENTVGFSQGVINSIQCFLITQATSLISKMAVGVTFMVDCWNEVSILHPFPNLWMLFTGLFLFIGCFILFLSFPFKLVDSMIRLMIFSALLPLWITFWVFPITQSKSKAGFQLFFNVLITFICLSIVLKMVLIVLESAFVGLSDWATFESLLINDRTEEAMQMIDWSGRAFFIFVAMLLMANSLVKSIDSFAEQFGGGGSLGVGAGLAATGLAYGQAAGKLGAAAVKKTTQQVGKGIGKVARSAKPVISNAASSTASATRRFFNPAGQTMTDFNENLSETVASTHGLQNAALATAADSGAQNMTKTSTRSSLKGGGVNDKDQFKFTTADGTKLQENTHEVNRDKNGDVTSTVSKREKFDPETGKSLGSVSIERDRVSGKKTLTRTDSDGRLQSGIEKDKDGNVTSFERTYTTHGFSEQGKTLDKNGKLMREHTTLSEDGNMTNKENVYDSEGRLREKWESVGDNHIGTKYDEKGREIENVEWDVGGSSSREVQEYDKADKRIGFTTEKRDRDGNITEKFKVDLTTNKKTDLLTGKVSDYIKPKAS